VTTDPEPVARRLRRIRDAIDAAAGGRAVRLVGAAKGVPADVVRAVVAAGLTEIGENYVRELRAKAPAVAGARWHYLGTLQTGTAHHVADLADIVQTLTGGRSAERLARRAHGAGRTLDALIEVDLTGERIGVPPDDLERVADEVADLPGLRLVGIMTLPPLPSDPEDSRPHFARLRELRDRLRGTHPDVVELSMGMSLDYEVAVQEGATMVRIGTALFGPRS
jgi:pyridoxal phosphate enzyme (YggS family)